MSFTLVSLSLNAFLASLTPISKSKIPVIPVIFTVNGDGSNSCNSEESNFSKPSSLNKSAKTVKVPSIVRHLYSRGREKTKESEKIEKIKKRRLKEYYKKKIPPDIHQLICKEIIEERPELVEHLVVFSDSFTTSACPIKRILDFNRDLTPLKIVKIFLEVFPNLKTLDLSDTYRINLSRLNTTQIEELSFFKCIPTPKKQFLTIKEKFPDLKKLNLAYTKIASLEGLPSKIEVLELFSCRAIPTEEFLTIKKRFPNLKKINAGATNILASLDGLPSQIEELDLSYCQAILKKERLPAIFAISSRDEGLEESASSESQLVEPSPFDEFMKIARFSSLKKISLGHTNIASLDRLPSQLEELYLSNCHAIPKEEFLTIKERFPHLKKINLRFTKIASLEGLPSQLEELNLSYCEAIPKKEFLTIKERFPHLKKINLRSTKIASLEGLPSQLEELNLHDCRAIPQEEFLTIKEKFPILKHLHRDRLN